MITKELVMQWYSLSKDSYEFAQRAAAHGAAQREAELMGVGMEPFESDVRCDECGGDGLDPKNNNYSCKTCGGTGFVESQSYTATQLAAARLQGAEEARSRILNMTLPELAADDWLNAGKGERVNQRLLEALRGIADLNFDKLKGPTGDYYHGLKETMSKALAAIAAAEQEVGK